MASIQRSFYSRKQAITHFIKPESPCYNDGVNVRLFPFTLVNGVLDITYQGNTFQAEMVDISGVSPSSETDTSVSIFGSPQIVTSLGSNFKDYIRSWRETIIDAGSPINIYVAPQVIRVQEADITNLNANSGQSYLITTVPPSGDGYISGSVANDYRTTYIFKTPLTFTIVESGVTKYITFRTILDQE